ncbi:MAG: hypothetical protein IJ115_02735 [Erysipelotrichaceae bacterium]|nr:hypothetical protein [Erysipelotrichaceae bacterium]
MKKALLLILILFMLIGCSSNKKEEEPSIAIVPEKKTEEENPVIDGDVIDLTFMNSNAIYSEIYNMTLNPEDYVGKHIKVVGYFATGQDDNGNTIFGCIVPDALACCQQGLGFELAEARQYPDEFPEPGTEIVLEGTFTFTENEYLVMVVLKDAEISVK